MARKRVLVSGGAGFLGSHLCDLYIQGGWDVICVDNECTGSQENVAHLMQNPAFTWWKHDVTEGLPVDGDVHLVLHMASLASPPAYKKYPLETLSVGSLGTWRCLELAEEKGARFVFASTSEVYGDPAVSPQPESYWGNVNPVGPRSMYDESKRFGEALVTAFRQSRGVDAGIVRIFNTYGPRMRPDDGRVVTAFLGQIHAGEPLTIHGGGLQTRSFCYVADLVRGLAGFAESGHTGPMNLGNPYDEMSIRQLAERLCRMFGVPFSAAPPMPRQDENDPMHRRPDISLAGQVIGWAPEISFEVGMKATMDYLRDVTATS